MFRLVRDKVTFINILNSLKTNICLKDRDCFNKMRILGQKSIPGLEPKKKKNEDLVKITFTPDRDLDDYLRSKNLLEEKQKKKKQEEPKSEEEKKEEERRRALNIAALLSWSPDEPIVDTAITEESSDSKCNGSEIVTTQDEADEKCSEYNENSNNEMTEVEIEAAYEDLCAEISQEYVPVEDKGKDSFWPNSLQNKFSRARNVDAEFSKMEREEERKCKMTEVKFEEEEFMRMEEHHHQHQHRHNQHNQHQLEEEEFVRMEEQEDEEWAPSSPTEEWIGVVVEEVRLIFTNNLKISKNFIFFFCAY